MLIFVILKIKEPSQAGLWAGAYAIVSGPSQLVNRHPQRKRGAIRFTQPRETIVLRAVSCGEHLK